MGYIKITVIGAGYVGLVTATCFAELGNEVLCAKKTSNNLDMLQQGISPIYEPGLNELLQKNIKQKKLIFTTNIKEAINFSDVIFICVGTPQSENGEADLSQVKEVVNDIATYMDDYKLIIEKSTVPVNTHKWIKEIVNGYHKNIAFDVASNPEFLKEGSSVNNFMNPDRIVVGVDSERAENIFRKLYEPFDDKGHPILVTSPAEAELIKYASNSFLALKISYINMLAQLCDKVNANIENVANGIGADERIGRAFLNAGLGYGGSCLPKDVKAFIRTAENYDIDFNLLKETELLNKKIRSEFLQKVIEIIEPSKNSKIAIWGLSFKPNTDDIRAAASIDLIKELNKENISLKLYDPEAKENFKCIFPENENITYFDDKYKALENVDGLLILTEWDEFKEVNMEKMLELMKSPIIFDGRNIYDHQTMKNNNFNYYSIGRGEASCSDEINLIQEVFKSKKTESI